MLFGMLAQLYSFEGYFGANFSVIPRHVLVLLPHPSLLRYIPMHRWYFQTFSGTSKRFRDGKCAQTVQTSHRTGPKNMF